MNNKRLLLISVVLMLFIISISSVSAGELNADEDISINEELAINNGDLTNLDNIEETNLILNNNDNIVTNNDNNVFDNDEENRYADSSDDESKDNSKVLLSGSILNDPKNITVNNKTFRGIQGAIEGANEGDTIILSGTYSNDWSQVININKNLNFIGINNAILDAKGKSHIFNISAGVTIKNITFKNGKNVDRYYDGGGAIYANYYNLELINCTFINNTAKYCGAVLICNAKNCTFINNSATNGDAGAMRGNAVNCTFINNSASGDGGALVLSIVTDVAVNCTFINNSANRNGGAIFSYSSYNANTCTFINNSASGFGGALYATKGPITINSFINNHAGIGGSAIYFKAATESYASIPKNASCMISNCNFINCSDTDIISILGCPTLHVENTNFIKCNSSNVSSCFIVLDNVNSIEFSNNSIVNSSFRANGGVLHLDYIFSQSINISSCTFERNEYNDNQGLFHSNRRDIYFDNCSFIKHNLNGDGLNLVDGSSPANLVNCNFNNNYIFDNGTILNINKYNFPSGICHFENNTLRSGSLIYVENDLSTVSNLDFKNNTIYNYTLIDVKGENCTISNCDFINNFANENGILYFENILSCNLLDCSFESNNASKLGGAIYSKNSNLNIEKCIFNNNSAASGGALYVNGKSSILNIKDSTFEDNNGAIFLDEVFSSEFYNCSFIHNTAVNYGGAIHSVLSDFYLDKCNFSKNGANSAYHSAGGAIYSDESNFEITDCDFFANYAFLGYGGDIYTTGTSNNSYINNSRFKEDFADINYPRNGGIYGNCIVNNSNFTTYHDAAVEYGVAINCLFKGNYHTVIENGVAINCTFEDNDVASPFADDYDGIVLNTNVTNCNFTNNHAKNGGALAFTIENSYDVINCTFINNSASMSGGAISIVNASVNIANSTFENNTCNGSGAAVFIENATEVSIDHCDFVNCVAGDGSGSIKTDDAELLDVSDCVFDVIPEGIPVHYDSILVANDLSFAIDSNGILVVSLSDVRGPLVGKTITLTVNGNDYDNTTDSNGLARFNMKNYFSRVGNYSVSVSFAGDGNDGPNSTNVNVSIFNYKGILSITSSGKYYNDVNLSFRLYDMNTVKPISNANIRVDFSNGETINLVTGSDGSVSYILPFAPGTYNLTATVDEDNVDVDAARLEDIIISRIVGKIDITQAENVLTIRLFNQNTGEVYRNVNVTLKFNVTDAFNLTTNNQGIASYNMTELGFGTYSAIVTVPGDYKDFNAEILSSIEVKNYTHDKAKSQVSFSGPIVFDYGKAGSTTVAVIGGIIELKNIKVDGHPEAKISISDKVIKVSGLKLGSYTLHVKTTPDDDHYSVSNTIGITVRKVSAAIKASNSAAYYKENKKWNIKLIDTRTKKALAKMTIVLKVYTGKKYKTIKLTTNAKGIASIKASTWSVGKHKVIISFSKYGHTCKNLVRYVTVKKRVKLSYEVKSDALVDGSNLFVWAKQGKKPINKVKLRVLVYTGKKYKEYDLVTGDYKSDGKVRRGFIGYGTNMLSVGKHKIVIKPYAYKFTGSKTTYLTIKKSAKKYKQSQVFVSNGKRSMNY